MDFLVGLVYQNYNLNGSINFVSAVDELVVKPDERRRQRTGGAALGVGFCLTNAMTENE